MDQVAAHKPQQFRPGGAVTGGHAADQPCAAATLDERNDKSSVTSSDTLRSKLLLAAVPALIAGGIAIWVSKTGVSPDRARALAQRNATILDDSSMLATDLRRARKLLVNKGYNDAQPAKEAYAKARDRWSNEQLRLSAQLATDGIPTVAVLVYDRRNRNLVVDRCGVLVARDDLRRGSDCSARLRHEVEALTARQDALNADKPIDGAGPGVQSPSDFATNVRIADSLLERVGDCKAPTPDILVKPPFARCPDLKYLQYALNLRVNLVGLAQERIADALIER